MIKIQRGLFSIALLAMGSLAYANVETVNPTSRPSGVENTPTIAATTYADDAPQAPLATDPYESFNRFIFGFNEKVDQYLMKPIAISYNTIMPRPLNQGVHNVFNNIDTIPTLANDLLQFNFYQAANDSWRLLINTTLGIGGLFDVASRIGLKYYANDFGLTLATWGYDNSNYLVLPFFGPSTVRDGIGVPVDYYALSIYPRLYPESTRYQLLGLSVVDRRAQLLKFQQVLEEASIDKYVFVRNAYMQRRAHKIDENQHLGYSEREASQPIAETTSTETDNSTQPAATEVVEPVA